MVPVSGGMESPVAKQPVVVADLAGKWKGQQPRGCDPTIVCWTLPPVTGRLRSAPLCALCKRHHRQLLTTPKLVVIVVIVAILVIPVIVVIAVIVEIVETAEIVEIELAMELVVSEYYGSATGARRRMTKR